MLVAIWRSFLKELLRYGLNKRETTCTHILRRDVTTLRSQWPRPLVTKSLSVHNWVRVIVCARFSKISWCSWDLALIRMTQPHTHIWMNGEPENIMAVARQGHKNLFYYKSVMLLCLISCRTCFFITSLYVRKIFFFNSSVNLQ